MPSRFHQRSAPAPTTRAAPPFESSEAARILVVDDQTSNLEAIEALLGESGCLLVRAQSADEALMALLDHEFAAIILDIKMPGMGGIELAQLIKQRRRTRHVPILFLTAHMMDDTDVLRGYSAGAVDYLTKPVRAEILRSKIAVFIDLYRNRRALTDANAALRRETVERARMEDELRVANRDLEQRVRERTEELMRTDRRKDEFLASLAHELRNPLAPVRSAVEVLQIGEAPNPKEARALAILVRQLDHMTRLIDDLLDVSRITTDKLVLQREPVELSDIVANAVETSAPILRERKHTLSIELPPAPVVLEADAARLGQVFSNLLTNAAKYTAPGGDVRLIAEARDHDVIVRIRDNGIGIDREMLPRVFELFIQGDHSHDRAAGGLGVGLTLARRLVEMHGGRLEAESDGTGCGSEFSVQLPVVSAFSRTVESTPVQRSEISVSKRILVVDDNQDAAEMLAVLLTAWGQEPRVVFDGSAALVAAEEFRPEIVLLDIGLPGLDGYETARLLRKQTDGATMVLVAVTGWGQESDVARSRDAGFDHHMVKPVDPHLLRSFLNGEHVAGL